MKKILLIFIGIFLLSSVTAQEYGDITTGRDYDGLNFTESFLNASYVKGVIGNVRMSCSGTTWFCTGLLGWDTYVDELENRSLIDLGINQTINTLHPTGNYIFARKNLEVSISYLDYAMIRTRNPTTETIEDANRDANQKFEARKNNILFRALRHLRIRQTIQSSVFDV